MLIVVLGFKGVRATRDWPAAVLRVGAAVEAQMSYLRLRRLVHGRGGQGRGKSENKWDTVWKRPKYCVTHSRKHDRYSIENDEYWVDHVLQI